MWKRILKRAARAAVSLVVAGVTARYAEDPRYLLLQPLIAGAGKWLREKGVNWVPI